MEKKYTPKQRRKIYKESALIIFDAKGMVCGRAFGCHVLEELTGIDEEEVLKFFPEYCLFSLDNSFAWWHGREFLERSFAFLLSAEMTKGATE